MRHELVVQGKHEMLALVFVIKDLDVTDEYIP